MRILHVLDHSIPEASGYSLRSRSIILEQQKLGWRTFHVTGPKHRSTSRDQESVDGLTFYRTAPSVLRLLAHPRFDFVNTVHQLRKRLRAVIKEVRPDIIHAHSPCSNGLAALGLGPPVVYEMRTLWEDGSILAGRLAEGSPSHKLARALETLVLRRAAAVTTISSGLRAEILARGVPASQVTIIGNAVDSEQLAREGTVSDRQSVKERFALRDRYILGYVGSLFPWEGLELLLRAFRDVRAQASDVGLLIVGGGPQEKGLKEAADRLGISEHVIFTGRVAPEVAQQAYDAIDLLVYPRLAMRLTEIVTPLKPLEAMAVGKPLVASDVGGHRELIEHNETGVLFRAGDQDALVAAILRVQTDAVLRERLIRCGAQAVREERSWANVVKGYEPVYRSLLPDIVGVRSAPSSQF